MPVRRVRAVAGVGGEFAWLLGILLVAVVAAAPVVVAIVHVNSSVDALARVPLPEGGVVTLPHQGGDVIYYEENGSNSSAASSGPSIDLTITPVSAGASVVGLVANSSSSYSFGSHDGVEVFTVQVTHPGQFRISTTGSAGLVSGTDLAIGPGVPVALFILGVAATIVIAICGVGVLVWLVFRRARRARRRSAF